MKGPDKGHLEESLNCANRKDVGKELNGIQ